MKFQALPLAATLLAGTASAFQLGGKEMPQPETTMADNFPWRDPFTAKTTDSYDHTCEASKTFAATQYTLHDLFEKPPVGLFPWGDGLKLFFSGREYPGGWAGLDRHMYDRNLLMMDYSDLPLRVREWIEEQERSEDSNGKGLFAVFDKPTTEEEKIKDRVTVSKSPTDVDRDLDQKRVAIFAPGALYHILPLFVADGSDCQGKRKKMAVHKPLRSHHLDVYETDLVRSNARRFEQIQRYAEGCCCRVMAHQPHPTQHRPEEEGYRVHRQGASPRAQGGCERGRGRVAEGCQREGGRAISAGQG